MDLQRALVQNRIPIDLPASSTSMFSSVSAWFTTEYIVYAVIAILFVIVLVMYFSPSYVPKIVVNALGPYSLGAETSIIDVDDTQQFYEDSAGSFSAFVYLNPMIRTGSYSGCGTNPNQASCDDGTFAPCPCDPATNDCSVCNHSGYNSLFNIAGVVGLEVLNAPDASRQGKSMAQLIVQTEGPPVSKGTTNTQKYIETLPLPPILIQKWTMITIARDGRRFDIYYNDSMVFSQKTMYMPTSDKSNTNYKGVVSGSDGLVGQLAVANLYSSRQSSLDVSINYIKFADTRGTPYLNSGSTLGLTSTTPSTDVSNRLGLNPSAHPPSIGSTFSGMDLCPGGCMNAPAVRPASPLYKWSSPYA